MKIFVKNSKDEILPIENISEDTQVKVIKQKIIDKYNIDTTNEQLVIINNGTVLDDDDETLDYYGISDGDTIIFVRKYIGGYNK